jgi:N-acyl-phosphatidylethanolamine-hydrolysing phospholipase D
MPKLTDCPASTAKFAIFSIAITRRRATVVGAALFCTCLTLLTACSTVNPAYNPTLKHHRPNGFQNNYTEATDKSRADFLKWTLQRHRDGLPKAPKTPTPVQAPDLKFVSANSGLGQQPAITWVGHATMLVQSGGMNFLTDPMFSDRASPVQFAGPKRAQAPGLSLAQLPRIDVVLISHNHYDHLDTNSVKALAAQAGGSPLFLVPLGVKAWFADLGIANVQEMDWWDKQVIELPNATLPHATPQPGGTARQGAAGAATEVHFTPVQHWSARAIGDRRATLWGGWSVFSPEFHWYFSGDTGYSADFTDTQKRFADRQTPALGGGFDVALIAVGAYEPRWFMKEQHVNPAEAVQIHQDLRAKRSVGVHWGTFELTDEPLDQPPTDLAAARAAKGLAEADFSVMAIGETRKLPKR